MLKSLIGAALLCAAFTPQGALGAADDMSQRPSAPMPVIPAKDADTCRAQVVSRYVGAVVVTPLRFAVVTAAGHDRIRWIKPGAVVTQDYRPDRLNVILDDTGRIMTVRCG